MDTMKNILLSEKLIEKKDIKLKRNNSVYIFVFVIVIFSILPGLLNSIKDINHMVTSGFIIILLNAIMITKILI